MNNFNKTYKKLIDDCFLKICNSKSINELDNILNILGIEDIYRIEFENYPKIEFSITKSEIKKLEDDSLISNNIFNHDKIGEIDSTALKLLYAMAWKNGDLKKIKHIIQGIKEVDEINYSKTDGLVFYQFGKYLTKKEGEPIIDQHVLRAFKVYQSDINKEDEISNALNLTTVGKKEIKLIKDYKDWLLSDNISSDLKKELDYAYYIDKILFAVGKKIKSKKK
jgi:hypothetical protein